MAGSPGGVQFFFYNKTLEQTGTDDDVPVDNYNTRIIHVIYAMAAAAAAAATERVAHFAWCPAL